MMLFSQARGLPVLSTDDAARVGKVAGLTVDAATGRVTCLRLSGSSARDSVLMWDALEAVGKDAVIVRGGRTEEPAPHDLPAHHEAVGSKVLTEHGVEHGTVRDVAFDPGTGEILTLFTALGDISGDRLMGLGAYALVVRAESA